MILTREKALHNACHDYAIVQLYPCDDPQKQLIAEMTVLRRYQVAKKCYDMFARIEVRSNR